MNSPETVIPQINVKSVLNLGAVGMAQSHPIKNTEIEDDGSITVVIEAETVKLQPYPANSNKPAPYAYHILESNEFTTDADRVHYAEESGLTVLPLVTEQRWVDQAQVALTNNHLAQALLERCAQVEAANGILRDTVRLNDEWHMDNSQGDYVDSTLWDCNNKSLNMPNDDTALKVVLQNRGDIVERIRQFNLLAGNTDDVFNVRQAAMYFGLQLEEMAEKFVTLLSGTKEDESIWLFGEAMDQYGTRFKKGEFDHLFVNADRLDLLDDDVDQLVVTIGSLLSQGASIHGAMAEVHRSNMSKVFPDGTMHKDANGKIVKPETYSKPDLTPYVCRINANFGQQPFAYAIPEGHKPAWPFNKEAPDSEAARDESFRFGDVKLGNAE